MRNISILHPTDGIPVPPDTVNTLLIAASSGQAMDWPSGTQIARFTGTSTAGASINFRVSLESTSALAPSSGASTSTTASHVTVMGQGSYQIPGGSTGFSVAGLSSGYISVECWKK